MSGPEGQRAASPPSVHVLWSSDEVKVIRSGGRPEPPTTSALAHGQAAQSRRTHSSGRENLPVDELPSILQETNLQSISQEYNLRTDSFELIKCHGDLRADHFFDENDAIMVYEKQLKAGLRFPFNDFFKDVLKFHQVSVAQVHPNSWRILVAFRGLCWAK